MWTRERQQQEAGPAARAAELEELTQIYVSRGLDSDLAKKVHPLLSSHVRQVPVTGA